jgi:Transglycosylase-like domain/Putative peptidoglycan binding domain
LERGSKTLQATVDAVRRPLFAGLLAVLALACAPAVALADGGGAVAPTGGDKAAAKGAGQASASEKSAPVVLKRGDRGASVRKLQSALGITADGLFGSQTEQAVRRFQKRKGLTVDGIVGPRTRDALGLDPFAHGSVVHRSSGVRLPAALKRIAECESGSNPRAVSPGGRYRGKYQFSVETWEHLGGKGDPADASEAAQDRIALKLYRRSGTSPWPSCG